MRTFTSGLAKQLLIIAMDGEADSDDQISCHGQSGMIEDRGEGRGLLFYLENTVWQPAGSTAHWFQAKGRRVPKP